MPAPTKRVRMTKQQQLKICIKSEQCPGMTNRELATWAAAEFNLPKCPVKSTILATLHLHARLRSLSSDCLVRKEFRSPELLERDAVVAEFVVHAELERMPVSGGVIVAYAKGISKELAALPSRLPQCTPTGWLRHFLKRHGFLRLRAHGESGSVDMAAIPEHVRLLRTVIVQCHPQDVFKMDETAFYYRAVPRSSVCLVKAPASSKTKRASPWQPLPMQTAPRSCRCFFSAKRAVRDGYTRSQRTSSTQARQKDG